MTDNLNDMARNDLPSMPQAVARSLDEWMFRTHGSAGSAHQVGLFIDLLYENGYMVEPVPVADARSYTTIETLEIDRSTEYGEGLTESRIRAEDPSWDEEPPARSLA